MENPQSVAGIIFSPDKTAVLLILRRDVPVWVLPGGGIDPNESPETAIIREILEETSLSVKINRLVGRYYPINRLARRTLLYLCSVESGTPSSSSETRSARYFPLNALPPMPPPYLEWIEDALQNAPPIERNLTSVNYLKLIYHTFRHPILVARFLLARLGWTINS